MTSPLDLNPRPPASNAAGRMLRCAFRQRSRTLHCPETPRLDGQRVWITGGASGVGEFVSRGLLARGAHVTSLSRGVSKSTGEITGLEYLKCDLADPSSIQHAAQNIGANTVDVLICNSGIVVDDYRETSVGVEKTFGVNVLGHHLLYRLLIERGAFRSGASIVMTAGDAYVMATNCVPAPKPYSSQAVYCSSKLGNMWQTLELARRYTHIRAVAIHPGVVASGFGGGSKGGLGYWLRSQLMISEEQGAQAALIAATHPLPSGSYWHNTVGLMELPTTDIANDVGKATELWETLEGLAVPWISGAPHVHG